MKILYFTQYEVTHNDVSEILTKMGHKVEKITHEMTDYCVDYEFSNWFKGELEKDIYDMIFSVYFIPLVAKMAFLNKIKYVVWVFDAMTLSMYSEMIYSPYNYVFTFDRQDCEFLREKGVKNIWHLPLAVNVDRVQAGLRDDVYTELEDSVTFLGSLYTGEYDLFSQIKDLPDGMKGYIDAIVSAQLCIPGFELMREMVTKELAKELENYAMVESGDEFFYTSQDVFLGMLLKKTTIEERKRILTEIAEKFKLTLFTNSDAKVLTNVIVRGYADYYTEMPQIFHKSAININITHRAIKSGISLRVLDVMGAGGFLISNYQPELCELFVPGEEFVCYYNTRDLLEKIDYYLKHPKERKKIAQKGKEKVEKYYTYEKQFEKMFAIIEEKESLL